MANDFKTKYAAALNELKSKDIDYPSLFNRDLIFVLLKKIGLKIPPPYYNSSRLNKIAVVGYSLLLFFLAWFLVLSKLYPEHPPSFFILAVLILIVIIDGEFAAKSYSQKSAKHNLSKWEDF